MNPEVEKIEFEDPKASIGAQIASILALDLLKSRSFSERHPELGKMIKCQVCQTRHRSSQKCQQKFVYLYTEQDLETGKETDVFAEAGKTRFGVVGRAAFKGRRLKPHPNKRMLQFIELVRNLLPDEYTEEDMTRARKKATRMLIKKFGRFGFLPRKSAPQPKKEQSA